ncbi:MAG: 4-(cytidine 5'-diphospho)-2-C-methyl-D-erythritol kinase [Lachnospiraceae bacterium]|nr:4-(cytidine 5'-diphospho)-2-C-methyl-D-erythritol kinase [Lachnospiraceae bacterium]
MSGTIISREAYGKINLGLDVLGRREDGYHLVRMIMQTVSVADTLTFERTDEEGVLLKTDSEEIPDGKDNLVCRAAQIMQEAYALPGGVKITLTKRIPVAAGMAGGSTDAAAVFLGLRDLYGLDASDEALQKLALPLGADIPYCILGGTRLAENIGEKLTALPPAPACPLVIVKPDLFVSTGWVYKKLDSTDVQTKPDIDGLIQAIREQDVKKMALQCANVLEEVTAPEYPVITELEQLLMEAGALNARMTGSGPTVFALFDDTELRDEALLKLRAHERFSKYQSYAAEFV